MKIDTLLDQFEKLKLVNEKLIKENQKLDIKNKLLLNKFEKIKLLIESQLILINYTY
jgi:hypothetical protein